MHHVAMFALFALGLSMCTVGVVHGAFLGLSMLHCSFLLALLFLIFLLPLLFLLLLLLGFLFLLSSALIAKQQQEQEREEEEEEEEEEQQGQQELCKLCNDQWLHDHLSRANEHHSTGATKDGLYDA